MLYLLKRRKFIWMKKILWIKEQESAESAKKIEKSVD
jgi:hypothetical protein